MLITTLALPLLPAAAAVVHVQLTRRAVIPQSLGAINTDVGSGYSFPIALGTPPQNLSVFLGLGSGNGLTMFGCNDCPDTPFYQPKRSSTWNKTENTNGPFAVAFDTAHLLGNLIPGAPCAYGNSSSATQQYGAKTRQAGQLSFGLGLTADPKIQAVIPALAPGWDEPVFGVHLGASGGQLSLGGVDKTLFSGDLVYVPTVNNRTWNFAADADGLRIDGAAIDAAAYLASQAAAMAQPGAAAPQADEQTRRLVIRPEMGADFMQITPQLAEKLFAPIAGAQRTQAVQAEATEPDVRRSTGMPSIAGYGYDVPCNTSANISLRVNGSDWTIPAAKWVVPSGTGAQGMCKTRVRVAQDEGGFRDELYDVLVGSLFLDSIYSAYRYDAAQPQIGFAQLSDKAKDAATSSAAVAQPTASGKSGAVRKSAGAGLLAAAVAVAALTV